MTNTVFPPGALLRVTFDCNTGVVAPGDLVCTVTGEGGSGEVCCWTTALVKVTVTP